MIRELIVVSFLSFCLTCWGQEKDSLNFKINTNYVEVKKNYEDVHSFILKKEKLVTSAFGKIVDEKLFHFSQVGLPIKSGKRKPRKILRLKKFLKKNRSNYQAASSNQIDAYKLKKYFDEYVIYFIVNDCYVQVKVHTSLAE